MGRPRGAPFFTLRPRQARPPPPAPVVSPPFPALLVLAPPRREAGFFALPAPPVPLAAAFFLEAPLDLAALALVAPRAAAGFAAVLALAPARGFEAVAGRVDRP